jgi:hyaluronan synthase
MRTHNRLLPSILIFVIIVGMIVVHYLVVGDGSASVYGLIVLSLLAVKLFASVGGRPRTAHGMNRLTTTVVVPVYNEDPAMVARCLDSLSRQTSLPTNVVVVDDGSGSTAAYQHALSFRQAMARLGINLVVHRWEDNKGKREALAYGFHLFPQVDLQTCVDSDTLLDECALEELKRCFADERVTGATGLVLASNRRTNILTRLIDLRYASAFLAERAAYSRLGAVLCCCGSLSAYRSWVVGKYLDDFLNQTFLGQPAVFGDDRRLTNYALLEGTVVFQESAVAWTAVPERLGHYRRQQVRWNKSFWRESLWAVRHLPAGRPAMWLSLLELTTWATFTVMLTIALAVKPFETGAAVLVMYGGYLSLLAYARSVRYFQVPSMPGEQHGRFEKAGIFLLAPLYGLLHIVMMLPLRFYALATLRKGGWGTRTTVEVTVDTAPPYTPVGAMQTQYLPAVGTLQ